MRLDSCIVINCLFQILPGQSLCIMKTDLCFGLIGGHRQKLKEQIWTVKTGKYLPCLNNKQINFVRS